MQLWWNLEGHDHCHACRQEPKGHRDATSTTVLEKKLRRSDDLEGCKFTRTPRVHRLMDEAVTKAVRADAKDTPRITSGLVGAAVHSKAMEWVCVQHRMRSQLRFNVTTKTKVGGNCKAASGSRTPNLGQQKVWFHRDGGNMNRTPSHIVCTIPPETNSDDFGGFGIN